MARDLSGNFYVQYPHETGAEQEWLNRRATDQRTIAERNWRNGLKPHKDQLPCDVGLFSDDHLQLDLVEMLQDATNGE